MYLSTEISGEDTYRMSLLLQLNYALFQTINSHAGSYSWLDALMVFCADYLIFCFPLVLVLMWGRPVNWHGQQLSASELELLRERRAAVLWTAFACLAAYGINLAIERVIFEPRPFVSHHVHQLIAHAADGSFPSDHTAWSFAVTGMFLFLLWPVWQRTRHLRVATSDAMPLSALLYPVLITLLTLVIGCLVGLARIYTGVHYPLDILGGVLSGLIAALLITLIRYWLSRPTNAVIRFAGSLRLA